jgi:hypothetical protein
MQTTAMYFMATDVWSESHVIRVQQTICLTLNVQDRVFPTRYIQPWKPGMNEGEKKKTRPCQQSRS